MPRKGLVQHSCLYVTPYITLVCSEVEAAVPSSTSSSSSFPSSPLARQPG